MSGAVAAHASYNGSGTQGLAATNSTDGGEVSSVFWNENDTTRQILHGSALIEVQSSGASTLSFNGSRLFTINNDIDCLGDLYLQLSADLPIYGGRDAATNTKVTCTGLSTTQQAYNAVSGSNATVGNVGNASGTGTRILAVPSPFSMYDLIERVEIQVGNQTWQTLEKEDIRVVNSTELDPTAFAETASLTSPKSAVAGDTAAQRGAVDTGSGKALTDLDIHDATAWIVIPAFTKTVAPSLVKYTQMSEDGYPLAAAPFQTVKINVKFRDAYPDKITTAAINVSTTETSEFIATGSADLTETKGVKNSRFNIQEDVPYEVQSNNFVVNTSAGAALSLPSFNLLRTGTPAIKTCRLFAKQIVMSNAEREAMKTMPSGLPKRLKMTQNVFLSDVGGSKSKTIDLDSFSLYASHLIITGNVGGGIGLQSVELKLNSSSFSSVLPAALLDAASADSMGLYPNKYIFAGQNGLPDTSNTQQSGTNSFTGEVREFRAHNGFGTFVFPLASRAYGGSSVPLNRFDSIRLTLKFTGSAVTSANSFINVTCVGKTTALLKNNAATLAMY